MIAGSRISSLIIAALVAAVWGYFADLRNGEYVSFAVRIAFVVVTVAIVDRLLLARRGRTVRPDDR
jgi:hypothetical protein